MTGFCWLEKILWEYFYCSLTCNLIIPKQPVNGTISIDIKPNNTLATGDTDISGSIELTEQLKVYVWML